MALTVSPSVIQSNEERVEEDNCSKEGMACATSANVHPVKLATMSLADLKSKSVTLGRRKQEPNLRSSSPSEFTRVRRLNTFRCEVKRPTLHRKLVSKAFSVSGGPSTPPTSSFEGAESTTRILEHDPTDTLHETVKEKEGTGKEVICVVIPSSRNERDDSAINEDEDEEDVQEVQLRLTRFPSDSNTSSISEDSSSSSSSPYHSSHEICSFCHNDFCSTDAIVYFGGLTLHLRCFRCGQCGQAMGNLEQFLVTADSFPMCLDCTPTCHTCGKSILRNHINVLGNDFHEGCLACTHCKRKFNLLTKVYSSNGEPCCAGCITPVFNEMWSSTTLPSSHSLSGRPTSTATLTRSVTPTPPPPALPLSPSTDSGVSESISNNEVVDAATVEETRYENGSRCSSIALPPKLESLSRGVSTYLDPSRAHSLLRPSLSDTTLNKLGTKQLSISSLRAILYDEYGVMLFMNYCMNAGVIELVVFWLDVEHFKHFDGGAEDLKLFAHHIVIKYVGYYAELPISIPRNIQTSILDQMQTSVTQDMFDQAQQFIYTEMERHLLHPFLQSEDGCNYLQMLVNRDLSMMTKISSPHRPHSEATTSGTTVTTSSSTNAPSASRRPIQASITKFDKRHLNTKFYVYEVSVERDGEQYVIYRRYSEWYALNRALVKAFPKLKFPVLPKKILLGRSQVRAVAKQRMQELQTFLQGILSMPLEVLNCEVLRKFLTQTDMDREDELFNKRVSEIQERNDHKTS